MNSFTSSSEGGTRPAVVFRDLISVMALPVMVFIAAVAAGELWAYHAGSIDFRTGVEMTIVREQVSRAETLGGADILFIGDSSALMGFDAAELEDMLGCGVESLATLGYAGPLFYSELLKIYSRHNSRIPVLVLFIHPSSLKLTDSVFDKQGYETLLSERKSFDISSPGDRMRTYLLENVVGKIVYVLLPGYYGGYYGSAADLAEFIEDNNGTAVDPGPGFPYRKNRKDEEIFYLSDDMKQRLDELGKTISQLDAGTVMVGLTPYPLSLKTEETDKARTELLKEVNKIVNAGDFLYTPAAMPDHLFVSATHLNEKGRKRLTTLIGRNLKRKGIGCERGGK